MLNGRVR